MNISGLSVIICCYNSVARLPATLQHLAAQNAVDFEWEVIIVDNNSTDDTAGVANREWLKYNLSVPLQVVRESKPGLSFARGKGIATSQHEIILFCDDDNWLGIDYVRTAHALMQDQTIGIVGGLNVPVADIAVPAWFHKFKHAYACGPQAAQDGDIDAGRLYITGAGMVTRKKIFRVLDEINFTSYLTDRTGADLSSGGDTEFSIITALLGYRLVYSSKLLLQHYMENKRLTWSYFLKLTKGHGQSYYKLDLYKQLYEKDKLNNQWLSYFQSASKVRAIVQQFRRALYYCRVYIRNKEEQVGSAAVVEAIFNMEMWKTHLRFRSEYTNFVNSLNELKQRLRSRSYTDESDINS